jgi:DNA-binding response OmpR family regulator
VTSVKRKVLVIDDSVVTLEWVRQVLSEAGFQVIALDRAIGTGAAIIRERPELVMVDVSMPTLDGGEVVALAKKSARPGTRIVLHSSLEQAELAQRAHKSGADGYIEKTNDKQEFIRQVLRQLEPVPPKQPMATLSAGASRRVLLINRLAAVRRFLALVLTEVPGIVIEETADSTAAALQATRAPYHLWIIDHDDMRQDCVGMVRQLRASCRPEHVPPMVITSRGMDAKLVEQLKIVGATYLLPKPVEAFTLLDAVRAALSIDVETTPEARKFPRLSVPVIVRFTDEPTLEVQTSDISARGAFIFTDRLRPPNAVMKIAVLLPHLPVPLTATCRVVHVRAQVLGKALPGFGVTFEPSSPDELRRLDDAFKLPEGES